MRASATTPMISSHPSAPDGRGRIRRFVLQVREPELTADGIAVRPVLPGHRLVDHGKRRASHDFVTAPETSLRQRNVQQREILRADEIGPGDGLLERAAAENLERAVAAVRRRRGVGRDPGRHHLRHRGDGRAEPLEILGALLPRPVSAVVDGDRQRHRVLRVVSEVGVRQPQEPLARRASRGQHQQRQRDLDARP